MTYNPKCATCSINLENRLALHNRLPKSCLFNFNKPDTVEFCSVGCAIAGTTIPLSEEYKRHHIPYQCETCKNTYHDRKYHIITEGQHSFNLPRNKEFCSMKCIYNRPKLCKYYMYPFYMAGFIYGVRCVLLKR